VQILEISVEVEMKYDITLMRNELSSTPDGGSITNIRVIKAILITDEDDLLPNTKNGGYDHTGNWQITEAKKMEVK